MINETENTQHPLNFEPPVKDSLVSLNEFLINDDKSVNVSDVILALSPNADVVVPEEEIMIGSTNKITEPEKLPVNNSIGVGSFLYNCVAYTASGIANATSYIVYGLASKELIVSDNTSNNASDNTSDITLNVTPEIADINAIPVASDKDQNILTPEVITNLVDRISDEECRVLGIDPKRTKPSDLILNPLLIPAEEA